MGSRGGARDGGSPRLAPAAVRVSRRPRALSRCAECSRSSRAPESRVEEGGFQQQRGRDRLSGQRAQFPSDSPKSLKCPCPSLITGGTGFGDCAEGINHEPLACTAAGKRLRWRRMSKPPSLLFQERCCGSGC
ncbi:hypothetical protein AGIG_G24477 [Arapaima gigas]